MKSLLALLLCAAVLGAAVPAAATAVAPDSLGATPIYARPRNPAVAGMLSFFIPGAGHFYCGHKRTGVLYMVGTYGTAGLGGILVIDGLARLGEDDDDATAGVGLYLMWGGLGLHVVDIAHAVHSARAINMGLAAGPRGQPALMLSTRF